MNVEFKISGGLIGVERGCSLDSADMPEELVDSLSLLVQSKDKYQNLEALNKNARDFMSYDISIVQDGERMEFEFNDLNLPDELFDLIYYLNRQTRVK